MVIRPGQVYRGFISEDNKVKRFVILSISMDRSEVYFLLINSNLTPFAENNPYFKRQNLLLKVEGRSYLDHDSYLCCETVHSRNKGLMTNSLRWCTHIGNMSSEDLDASKDIIRSLPIYSPYELEDFGIDTSEE